MSPKRIVSISLGICGYLILDWKGFLLNRECFYRTKVKEKNLDLFSVYILIY